MNTIGISGNFSSHHYYCDSTVVGSNLVSISICCHLGRVVKKGHGSCHRDLHITDGPHRYCPECGGNLKNLTPLPGIPKGGKEIPRQNLWVHIWADWDERPTALGKMLLVVFYYLFYSTLFSYLAPVLEWLSRKLPFFVTFYHLSVLGFSLSFNNINYLD